MILRRSTQPTSAQRSTEASRRRPALDGALGVELRAGDRPRATRLAKRAALGRRRGQDDVRRARRETA